VSQTLQLLLAGLLGATVAAGCLLAGGLLAGRPTKANERRLDRALAISEAERSRLLAIVLARSPEELSFLTATAPAQPPPTDRTLGGPPEPRPPWEAAEGAFTPDPNVINEWDELDDAAFNSVRH
jgi:hypothetical protein